MTREEFEKIEKGTTAWISYIVFNDGRKGIANKFILAQAEHTGDPRLPLKVVKVEKGTSLKPGKTFYLYSNYNPCYEDVFLTREEAVVHWNCLVRNEEDLTTSLYETAIKRIREKLIEK